MIRSSCKILLLFFILCFMIFSCDDTDLSESQAEKFVRFYPTDISPYGEGTDLFQTADGNYTVLGSTIQTEGSISNPKIMLINTDEYGFETGSSPKLIGTPSPNYGHKILATEDGSYVIAGSARQNGSTYGYIIKFNAVGELVFEHSIGSAPLQEFNAISATSDGGFILAGYCKELNGDQQVYLVKTDFWGLTAWERVMGFTEYNDLGVAVLELNGRFIVVGTTSPVSSGSANSRLLILNTNAEGKGMTETRISGNGDLTGADMVASDDGNIIILGNEDNSTSGKSAIYLTKIKLEGFNNELISILYATSMEYPESLHGSSMILNSGNSLAVCGWRENNGDRDILFTAISGDFILNNIQFFGSRGYQSGTAIAGTRDGGYIITGGAEVANYTNTVLIKLGPDGKLD